MDNFRLVLILALAFVSFLLWQAWQEDYGPEPRQAAAPATQQGTPGADAANDVPQAPAEAPPAGDVPDVALPTTPQDTPGAAPAPGSVLESAGRIQVETDLLRLSIDLRGGDLREADLLQYPVSLDQPDEPVRLLDDSARRIFVAQSGLLSRGAAPTHHAVYEAERQRYTLGPADTQLEVPLTWREGDLEVRKIYTFRRDSYVIDVRYEVRNAGAEPWTGSLYSQLQRTPPLDSESPRFIYTYTGAVLHGPEHRYDKVDFGDMEKSALERRAENGWAAMIQHYFAGALLPPAEATNTYYTKALPGQRYVVGVVLPAARIAPGGMGDLSMRLYVGPKEQERLAAAAPDLDLIVDYGWLYFLAKPLFWLLDVIHDFVGNWGWAIVILTLLIKLAFFHLSATSYRSMARMRKLQPRLMALKERYGDDKQRMNQAMMDLYKEEKVNPLGGCLPILVQIPVFIALYWVLLESVELRQSGFIFWIKDLSTYDPYFVLPLLMGASMFLQTKLNPAPMDPIQQKIMLILPVVFTVFFLFFPAGLVLYWLVNNTLSILQQWVITRKIVAEK
jgi:YidC/Oxa1 family membrane protein insertase